MPSDASATGSPLEPRPGAATSTTAPARAPGLRPVLAPFAWRPVLAVAVGTVVVLLATAGRYGYHRDELYFRMLGFHPAWGYTDQPPLTPLIARAAVEVLGDSLVALRTPAALLAGVSCVLAALLARELGGRTTAQLLATGAALGALPLIAGHTLLTMSADLPLTLGLLLLVLRALLRDEPRWWPWAGLVAGLALYNKLLVVLLLAAVAAGIVAVGPRRVLREPLLWLGVLIAVVVGAPNLVYQVVEGFPQADMAAALAEHKGDEARMLLVPMQLVSLGLLSAPVWIAGFVAMLRRGEWRPIRALPVAYLLICAFLLVQGGQFYYTIGLLQVFFAAGCVRLEAWIASSSRTAPARATADPGRVRRRTTGVAAALAVNVAVGAVIALPLLPLDVLGRTPVPAVNQTARDQVGWIEYVGQVQAAFRSLPPADQARAVLVTGNYGEAGALDRYGPARGLPAVYSGQNALHRLGPPPESATAVVAVVQGSGSTAWLSTMFASCAVADHLDNGVGVDNEEQGTAITVCTGRLRPWSQLWPQFAHLD